MPHKSFLNLHGSLAGAREIQKHLSEKHYFSSPKTDSEEPYELISVEIPGASDANSPKPEKRVGKIRFNNGLGWCEETGTWWAHYRVGKKTPTDDTGQRRFEDAEVWLSNHKRVLKQASESGEIRGLTVAQGLELWAREAPVDSRSIKKPGPRQVETVMKAYRNWILPSLGPKAIDRLTDRDLADVVTRYRETPGPAGPHQENGIRNLIVNLNTPLRWLRKRKKIRRLPDLPATPKAPRREIVTIPAEFVFDVLERFDRRVGYDIYAMVYIRLLAFTGIRTENARLLQKEQFNQDLTRFDTGRTKNDNRYFLPIPEDLREYLRRIPDLGTPGPLFPGIRENTRREHGWCLKAFRMAAKDIGVTEKIAWHRLRATYATLLIRSGADIFVLMEALGWETMYMALLYIRTVVEDVAFAQEKALQRAHAERRSSR